MILFVTVGRYTMKRRLFITSIILTLILGIATYAGTWTGSYESGWRYLNDNGTYVTNSWMQDTDGQWYYFGADGVMLHDTWVEGQYYLGPTGAMLMSTITPDGYQVGADGKWIPGVGPQTAQAVAMPFDEIVEGFRQGFIGSTDETVQLVDIHGENNNTIVMTLNIIDGEAAGYESLYVSLMDAVLKETLPETMDPLSQAYGQHVYLRITYMVNGRAYGTKSY